ncbi:MAG: hypothetical protein ABWX92_17975 [Mycetocola sp.]
MSPLEATILAAIFLTLTTTAHVGFSNRRKERDARAERAVLNGRRS